MPPVENRISVVLTNSVSDVGVSGFETWCQHSDISCFCLVSAESHDQLLLSPFGFIFFLSFDAL
jgi:hypothetical protein